MKRRLPQVIIVFAVFVGLLVGALLLWTVDEPGYQGRTLTEWVDRSRSRERDVREEAEQALLAMRAEAVPHLAGDLKGGETVTEKLNRTLGNRIPPRVRRLAGGIFNGRGMHDRKADAVHALQTLGTNAQEAIPALGELLRGSNPLLSGLAGRALAEMGPAAVPELIKTLDDGNYSARANACSALGQLRTNALPAAPRLVEILYEESGPILGSASYALARIGQGALPALEPAFAHTSWVARRWAAYAVGFMRPGPVNAEHHLYPLTRDPNGEVRLVAVQSLGRMHISSPEGSAVLRERFEDPNPEIRAAAIQAFANSPWLVPRHLDACVALLEDSSPQVRGYAAQALMNIGPISRPALPALEKLALDEHPFAREKALLAIKSLRASEERN